MLWQALSWCLGTLLQAALSMSQWHRLRKADDTALLQHARLATEEATNLLGSARLGDIRDAAAAGLLNRGAGLPLGFMHGAALSYLGDGHLATYGGTGAGKFRDIKAPVLATCDHESFVVLCVKDGEITYSTLNHRAESLGQPVLVLNPSGLLGLPTITINPLDRLVERASSGLDVVEPASDVAEMLVPIPPAQKEPWPKEGAQELLTITMCYLAHGSPQDCHLPGVRRLLLCDDRALCRWLTDTVGRSHVPGGIPESALSFAGTVERAGGQWSAIKQEISRALRFVAPGSAYAAVTERTSHDLRCLKQVPTTLYLTVNGRDLKTAAPFLGLVLDHLFETLADAPGQVRTTFLLDEFLNLPTLSRLPKAIHMYRKRLVRLWFFIQSRAQLAEKYSPEFADGLDQACAVMNAWNIEDPDLVRRLEYLGGKKAVLTRTLNAGSGTSGSAGWSLTEQARPLLQPEDIRLLGPGEQILRITGHPFFIATRVPYYEIDEVAGKLLDPREVSSSSRLEVPAGLNTAGAVVDSHMP